MKFLQQLIFAIFLPRKKRQPVRFQLSKDQQRKVVQDCQEINLLIREIHGNLADIRAAGKATSKLTKRSHDTNVAGRKNLQQQKLECERINGELKKIADDMRAVRENVALTSQKAYRSLNQAKLLESKVVNITAQSNVKDQDEVVEQADVIQFPAAKKF